MRIETKNRSATTQPCNHGGRQSRKWRQPLYETYSFLAYIFVRRNSKTIDIKTIYGVTSNHGSRKPTDLCHKRVMGEEWMIYLFEATTLMKIENWKWCNSKICGLPQLRERWSIYFSSEPIGFIKQIRIPLSTPNFLFEYGQGQYFH